MKIYNNIHDAYLGTLADVYDNPEFECAPRGQKIKECLDYQFRVLCPEVTPIITKDEERNKIIAEYTAKETALYDSCSNNVEDFAKASSFWRKIANNDGTINSAYGYLIWKNNSCGDPLQELSFIDDSGINPRVMVLNSLTQTGMKAHRECKRTPWEWCVQSLKADKDTRQAHLKFSLPEHLWIGNKDQVCTLHANFLIRDDKLNMSVVMRSNDLMLGLVYDLPWFVSLMDKMIDELKRDYPSLTKGHYTHTVHSMHIYERDEEKVMKMLGRV